MKCSVSTNLVLQSQTVRLRHSSCRPKWSLPQTSWLGPPCHLSDGAHTRCLWPQTEHGILWRCEGGKQVVNYTCYTCVCICGWERQSVHVSAWTGKSLLLVDLLKDVFEATIVLLQDGVLGAQVQRPAFGQTHLEWTVGKVPDGLICIVHPHGNTTCAWTDTCRLCKLFYLCFIVCSVFYYTSIVWQPA